MAVVQNTYPATPPIGFPGMVPNGELGNRITRTVEDAAGLAFGKSAWRGVNDHGVTGTPTAGTFMGWVIADHGQPVVPGGVAADIVPQYDNAALKIGGTIYVNSSVAVADGDQVYVTSAGLITNVSSGNVIVPNWVFDLTLASAGVVRLARR